MDARLAINGFFNALRSSDMNVPYRNVQTFVEFDAPPRPRQITTHV